ncbi:MAG TPA: secondary thiamine-phosphate synthase enzyme YjbQ [Methanothrix sp.]|nr:secondary thiamine-phosphate synthase enzyme YjbQ [Methanothrix sp.]
MIFIRWLEFETEVGSVRDITGNVCEAVLSSGLEVGIVTIFVPGATGAVTTLEHEEGLVRDLGDALERLAPQGIEYAHNERWHDGNGHSHVRASIIGPSLTVPFSGQSLILGTWQQIVFLELDTRPRHRRVMVQILGEREQ